MSARLNPESTNKKCDTKQGRFSLHYVTEEGMDLQSITKYILTAMPLVRV
jgi:hypothetical protein